MTGSAAATSSRVRAIALVALLALALAVLAAIVALPAPAAAAAARKAPSLRLKAFTVKDPMAGTSAFRMLVPAGWRVSGGITWDLRYHTLTSTVMQIRSPSGREAVQSYPIFPHVWDTRGIFGFSQGSIYLGAVVQPPMSAVAYLEQLVVPTYRGSAAPRIVAREQLSSVASRVAARAGSGFASGTRFDAARVRIAYTQGGRAVEEDFYTLLSSSVSPLIPTMTTWSAYSLYSFRAPSGTLKRYRGLLQAMVSSVRPNLKWYAVHRSVQKMWEQGQMQAIQAAGELSRRISAANDEITASLRSSYESSQRSSDRISNSFSERIRGVETYDDPFSGREVQLPSDHSYAWASSSGEYVFSDSAGFNPNVGSTTTWRLLKPS